MFDLQKVKCIKPRNNVRKWVQVGLLPALILFCSCAFADGTDLLAGTADNLITTLKGTGKTFLYVAEIIVACYLAIKTRNPAMFFGFITLAVAFDVMLHMAGI